MDFLIFKHGAVSKERATLHPRHIARRFFSSFHSETRTQRREETQTHTQTNFVFFFCFKKEEEHTQVKMAERYDFLFKVTH
jgi:hypothetical protein